MFDLKNGESLIITGRGGWKYKVTRFDFRHDIKIFNPTEDKQEKFFNIDTAGNPYGAPKCFQEPSLGVSFKEAGVKVDRKIVEVDGKIVGALVLGVDGKIEERFSWSNVVFVNGGDFDISLEGELIVNGESKGYLRALFLPDKNRFEGYVGIFSLEKVEKVKILEMEDLTLNLI